MNLFNSDSLLSLASRLEDISILHSHIGKYIHFSNSERFGISFHKKIHYMNPRGLYGFPLTKERISLIENSKKESFYEYGNSKYVYIYDIKGKTLNLDSTSSQSLFNDIKDMIIDEYSSKLDKLSKIVLLSYTYDEISNINNMYGRDNSIFNLIHKFYDIMKTNKVIKDDNSFSNIVFRRLGFDSIMTNDYGFDDGIKSQIVTLNPNSLELIAKIDNPMIG